MKKSIYVISGVIAMSAASIAMSQNAGPRGFMADADMDKNGTIEKSEFEAMYNKRYAETDQNGDGITFEEYESKVAADREAWRERRDEMRAQRQAEKEENREARAAERAERNAERTKRRFESLDADGNGTVSEEEYKMAGEKMFDRMDRNNDGILNDRRDRGDRRGRGRDNKS